MREMLHAYLKSQAADKAIHQLTKAFEHDASNEELLERLSATERLLQQVSSLIRNNQ